MGEDCKQRYSGYQGVFDTLLTGLSTRGAKRGLLQFESWSSDGVAVDGRALQGTEGGVALGDSWFAGLLPESWVHITGHTGLTGPTGQGGG